MPQAKPVVLFLVDGMRPDGLQRADTPTMDHLIATGAHTMSARTVMPSITLPCHASLFLGVMPARHGITTNAWAPPARPVPGIFEVLHDAGHTAACFYNWEQLRDLGRPGTLDASFYVRLKHEVNSPSDQQVATLAAGWLRDHQTDFCFVYLGYTDIAGHGVGWMTVPYLEAIAGADRCIGHVLKALPDDALVIVTADHGGHEQAHGTDSDEDMTIPFIISGPGIPADHTIDRPVNITDIAPTIIRQFGLESPREWIGTPITCNA